MTGTGDAAAPLAQARRYLHRTRSHGDIGASAGGSDGLFNADTRYLAGGNGARSSPAPVAGFQSARRQFGRLTIDLTNPTCTAMADWCCRRIRLHIVRLDFPVARHGLPAIALQNHGDRGEFRPTLLFDNDFAICSRCAASAVPHAVVGSSRLLSRPEVLLEYSGLDGLARVDRRCISIGADPACVNSATYHFECARRRSPRFRRGILQQADYAQARAIFPRPVGSPSRDAAIDARCSQH